MLHCLSHILSRGPQLQSDTCAAAHMKPNRGERFSVAAQLEVESEFGVEVWINWLCFEPAQQEFPQREYSGGTILNRSVLHTVL